MPLAFIRLFEPYVWSVFKETIRERLDYAWRWINNDKPKEGEQKEQKKHFGN